MGASQTMNHVERFRALMAFQPVDRLPVIEWAGWWDLTIDRWRQEGLPAGLDSAADIREYLGLDPYRQAWIRSRAESCPSPAHHGAGLVADTEGYLALKKHLYPTPDFHQGEFQAWAERQRRGELVVWITLDGFFWYPRTLLGIERHLYAFYDAPDLMHRINSDLLAHNLRALEAFGQVCTPSFATLAEDLSYNHGPMLSKRCFDQFLAPYYRELIPALRERGIPPDRLGWGRRAADPLVRGGGHRGHPASGADGGRGRSPHSPATPHLQDDRRV